MKCKQIQTLLADYSSQRLLPSEAERVQGHVSSCAVCARLLQEEAILCEQLAQIPFAEPASSSQMWAAVSADLSTPEPRRSRWLAWTLPNPRASVAALATTAVATVAAFTYFTQPAPQPSVDVASIPRIVTISKDVNRDVDDPLADHTDSLFAALDRVTGDSTTQ